jgi:DNA-binding MltR family transcriptional regulator
MSKSSLAGEFGFMSVARTQEEQQFYADFYASVEAETLRGKVMNITSYIDESLIHLLREFFPNTAHANKLLTNMDSCISTIMDRANMALALSLLRQREFEAIRCLTKIRNEFAHNWKQRDFEVDSIDKIVRKFPADYFKNLEGTNEAKYLFLSAQIIQDLMHREEYAARLRKHLPTAYIDFIDLSLEERQAIMRRDF